MIRNLKLTSNSHEFHAITNPHFYFSWTTRLFHFLQRRVSECFGVGTRIFMSSFCFENPDVFRLTFNRPMPLGHGYWLSTVMWNTVNNDNMIVADSDQLIASTFCFSFIIVTAIHSGLDFSLATRTSSLSP